MNASLSSNQITPNKLYAVTIQTSVSIYGIGSGSAWVDPQVSIDPTYAAAHPGVYLVFSANFLPPQLSIAVSETNVILSWPTNATGYTLEWATNLAQTGVWNTNFPPPVVISAQNTVTDAISGPQKFYRLKQ